MGAGKLDTDKFVEYGYVPHMDKGEGADEAWMFSASLSLVFCFGALAGGQMAKALGKTDDYNVLMDLSKGWERIYNAESNLIQPKYAD